MIKSKAQQKLMFAAAKGYTDKVPSSVANEYIESTPKDAFRRLKERLKPKLPARK